MSLQERIDELTPEQREEARNLNSPEETLEFAKKAGYELSIDELDAVSGGWGDRTCIPHNCGGFNES